MSDILLVRNQGEVGSLPQRCPAFHRGGPHVGRRRQRSDGSGGSGNFVTRIREVREALDTFGTDGYPL
jgi:hypothetical protein